MLGCNCLFRGHEMYQSEIYVTFMTHENPYSWLGKLFNSWFKDDNVLKTAKLFIN